MSTIVDAVKSVETEDETYGEDKFDSLSDYIYNYAEDVETPLGRIKFVDSFRSWPNSDPMINVVVEFDGVHYMNSSYYDSWGGTIYWDDSDWSEVEKVEVVTSEWRTK